MSRASWYRHGMPAAKPKRMTNLELARSVGVSVRTLYRAKQKRIARLRQYQSGVLHKLLKKHPRKSDQQIAELVNAHMTKLSGEQLAKIMDG